MKPYPGKSLGLLLVTCAFLLASPSARAEVTRVEISSRQDVLGGKSLGAAGSYEKLTGKIYFTIDPKNQHNKMIADLDKAPKNAQGRVEFSADIFILRPTDSSKGNGVVFLDIPNRGGKALLSCAKPEGAGSGQATPSSRWAGNLMFPRSKV